jgi:hypothetical protein
MGVDRNVVVLIHVQVIAVLETRTLNLVALFWL